MKISISTPTALLIDSMGHTGRGNAVQKISRLLDSTRVMISGTSSLASPLDCECSYKAQSI